MSVRTGLAVMSLLLVLPSTNVVAQNSSHQCNQLMRTMIRATEESDTKEVIASYREYLSFCRTFMTNENYLDALSGLASGLNGDRQPQESLAVSNRCLQVEPNKLDCLVEKANSLFFLNQFRESKLLAESGLRLPAITELDAASKVALQRLLTDVNGALKTPNGVSPRPGLPRQK